LSSFRSDSNATFGISADEIYRNATSGLTTEIYDALWDLDGWGSYSYQSNNYHAAETLTFGATIAINAARGRNFLVTATSATAILFSNPTNAVAGREITLIVRNSSGGVMGDITLDSDFQKNGTWVKPGNGNFSSITFVNFAPGLWIEKSRTEDAT